MTRRTRTTITLGVATAAAMASLTTTVQATPTTAAAKPIINFGFVNNQLEVGQKPVVRYSTKKVPKGGAVVLQRAFGTGNHWKTIAHLKGSATTKTVTEPAVGQGINSYRLVVTDHHGKALVGKVAKVTVYGPVALASLLDIGGTNTVNLGTSLFRYSAGEYSGYPSDEDFKITQNTCRSLSLQIVLTAVNTDALPYMVPGTITILSEGADAVTTNVPVGVVTTVTAPTSGDIEVDQTMGSEYGGYFFNGSADCSTPSGAVPTGN